jgi:hypothetical protein
MPVVVQYRTKPDRADENQRLVEKVFAELAERGPAGFRYISLRLADGNSFVHIVVEEPAADAASLGDMPAFKEFVAGIAAVPSSPSRAGPRWWVRTASSATPHELPRGARGYSSR